ncbi:hypothetical protein IC006_0406 [Sulfuracidifex tepidarius]|uniref:Uncharacterized protein n=1 Tax=Sulfuracidifex tepidarius TaxID=1294262 RepID=A0A510E081_9CREN|nr:hypothetical protein [Sulfuracidifex tepidarius]BBG23122.1 hypothetical protein IC006_0406 [Sulfuracidifex tepidarius]BBG25872.1 hypothetical protein IC007_0377 [Sulfuracidifex tepidarius]
MRDKGLELLKTPRQHVDAGHMMTEDRLLSDIYIDTKGMMRDEEQWLCLGE